MITVVGKALAMTERCWWLLLSNHDSRQYQGNQGYEDQPHRRYNYDSNVNNSRRLQAHDVLVIVLDDHVIGTATADSINSAAGEKIIRRCPQCPNTNLKARKTLEPKLRCDNGHEFDEPRLETQSVTLFEAHYADSFTPVSRIIDREQMRICELAPSSQGGIRPLDPEKTRRLFSERGLRLPRNV
jgi:hypothetical protein